MGVVIEEYEEEGGRMKHNEVTPRYHSMLRCFTHLPHQILTLHSMDNIAEFVLHSLSDEGCLGLSKAAYFIDNPDFDCLKGLAGFNKNDEIYTCDSVLDDKNQFKAHIDKCAFNQKVREVNVPSVRRKGKFENKNIEQLAGIVGIADPFYHSWPTKHDNYGLLIYERAHGNDEPLDQDFFKCLSLLGFCPVS